MQFLSYHAQEFGTILLQEFIIFYCHTERNMPSLLCDYIDKFCRWSAVKLKVNLIGSTAEIR